MSGCRNKYTLAVTFEHNALRFANKLYDKFQETGVKEGERRRMIRWQSEAFAN